MKKRMMYAVFAAIVASSLLASCKSQETRVEDAQDNVRGAKQDLNQAQRELNAEYPAFRADAEAKIEANDRQIADLRTELNRPGKAPLDQARKKKIDELQDKNAALRSRLYGYEKERTDWVAFKAEFSHDMEGIGEAFKDIVKNNKK